MPRQTEPNANNALAILLQGMMRHARVRSEHTRIIDGQPALQPDILITDRERAPVVIEAEYEPAAKVEGEAIGRLELPVVGEARVIEAAIALRYPESLRRSANIDADIADARLGYCVYYRDGGRFPASGWLQGGVADVADLTRLVSIPQRDVDAATDELKRGIDKADDVMSKMADPKASPEAVAAIARLLKMRNVPQTRRMACAMLANALIFQERVAALHKGVQRPSITCAANNPQRETLAAWEEILKINYYPIFAISSDILNRMPSDKAAEILRKLEQTAGEVNARGAANSRDLMGLIFQRLISDRKYLATFYTLPSSAALLARLAVAKMEDVDWTNPAAIRSLRVADFACGTGTLLAAVYDQFASRHERAGGGDKQFHEAMMQDALFGCDVMPSAVHIAGVALSGMQPEIGYNNSQLYFMPYGRQRGGDVKIGSLELLGSNQMELFVNVHDSARRTGSMGEETIAYTITEFPSDGFDLVIMNPPFTRPTNHEGAHANVPNPAFAAFEATKSDMDAMGKRMKELGKESCYDGKAGLASAFVALAHRKLKPGGVLAFVLPLSASVGSSWQKFRDMLAENYTDLDVISIAANGKAMAFSSDTGMAECLVVARKLREREKPSESGRFTSLARRPGGFAQASEIAKGVANSVDIRNLEDGPYGGAPLSVGNDEIAEIANAKTATQFSHSHSFNMVRVRDASVAQTAYALSQSNLWMPGISEPTPLKVCRLSDIGRRGVVDRLIVGPPHPAPFTKSQADPTATYPSLWNHCAKKETRMVCIPDLRLRVRTGMEAKADDIWKTASRCHINRDFTFGSQALAVAFTERESIGGRVWPSAIFTDERFDYAFAVWGNSTLGLLCYWWHSNRQQSSKASMTISVIDNLPTLDLRALTDAQLDVARDIFDDFRDRELKPAYIADADRNRALLDRRVVCDMLGFDESVHRAVRGLAAKWCAEPSVHGGKPRPKGAEFAV